MKRMCQFGSERERKKSFCCVIIDSLSYFPISSPHLVGGMVCLFFMFLSLKKGSKEAQLRSLEGKWDYIVEAASRHHRRHFSEAGFGWWHVCCRLI